jgi:diaminohydroxyphosphoribosylaminopyrimidine deaminase/5-amino-6-(5-phosphoribosylamino)uracil reductase
VLHNLTVLRQDYGCCRVLCEGGGRVGSFLLQHGLAQQLELHTAPLVMGDDLAPRLFSGLNPERLADALRLRPILQGRAGDDRLALFDTSARS